MKKNILAILLLVTIFSNKAIALPESGTWNATTINSTQTVNLTGKISLKGLITINSGAVLTINNNTNAEINIFNEADTSTPLEGMFLVKGGGTLIINGGSKGIVIGGGASFNDPTYDNGYITSKNALSGAVRTMTKPAIRNGGTLELYNVTIQNVSNTSTSGDAGSGGAITHITAAKLTHIENCVINKVKSYIGSGLFAASGSDGIVEVIDTEFKNCISTYDNMGTHCAVVRGWGDSKAHMRLTNVQIHHSFAEADAAAIYWPSNGKNKDGTYATLTMDGCEIYNNYAKQNGGGMDICASIDFVNNVTEVHNNYAGTFGGGISFRPYDSGDPAPEALNVRYNINDYLSVYGNTAKTNGGGIAFFVSTSGSTLPTGSSFSINLNGASVYNNTAVNGNGGGISMNNEYTGNNFSFSFYMNSGDVYENTSAGYGGGIYLRKWTIVSEVSANPFNLFGNTAKLDGGGYYIDGANYEMNGGNIYSNESETGNGGGIYIQSGAVTVNEVNVYGNDAAVTGGGIYVNDGNVTVTGGSIGKSGYPNNANAGRGGGIYIGNGDLTISGGEICYNKAFKNSENELGSGGGVFVNNGTITIEGGNIHDNYADRYGGGLCKSGSSTMTVESGSFIENTSNLGGGAIYSQGTGTLTLSGGLISNNESSNGGGIYQTGSTTMTMEGSVKIIENEATTGAGLYVNDGVLEFLAGEVSGNIASGNGGGVFVNGGSINFSGNIFGNHAKNGGGVFLASNTMMTFKGGIISGNKAKANANSSAATTAYHGGNGNIEGCGGGIYLQSGTTGTTSLKFKFPEGYNTFGLYTNEADKGGNDIVSEGGKTSVKLPRVSKMKLIGFEGVDANPQWYQDYFTEDSGYYEDGGHAVPGDVRTVGRFKELGDQFFEHCVPETDPEHPSVNWLDYIHERYLCLTLSFNMLDITIKANDLLGSETALFRLIRHGLNNTEKIYDILLTKKKASRTLRNMPWGTYSLIPNNRWNWAYDPIEPMENIRVGETTSYTFEFDMQHKSGALVPQHDEKQPGVAGDDPLSE